MREWLVIESSGKNAVFASDSEKTPKGYIMPVKYIFAPDQPQPIKRGADDQDGTHAK